MKEAEKAADKIFNLIYTARAVSKSPECKAVEGYIQSAISSAVAEKDAEIERLRKALLNHRLDLHNRSNRPCDTCKESALALGFKLNFNTERCPTAEEAAEALKGKKHGKEETDQNTTT